MESLENIAKKEAKAKLKVDQRNKRILSAKLDNITNNLPNIKFNASFILNALNAVMDFDIGFDIAVSKAEQISIDNNIDIESSAWSTTMRKKFSELIFLDRIIHITGFWEYKDEIMLAYVESMFTTVPASKKNKKQDLESLLNKLVKEKKL